MTRPGLCGVPVAINVSYDQLPPIGPYGGCGATIPRRVDGRAYVLVRTADHGDLLFHAECQPAGTIPMWSRGYAAEQARAALHASVGVS